MAIINKDSQPFRPYARLMNILGDQLITDKKVAVIEIIKNSYDADAENVEIRFVNMHNLGKDYLPTEELPFIEIIDDGSGMTLETIKKSWLRPATPNKYQKKLDNKNLTEKGRIIQGEKGIGRFAIHKLGEKIEVFTKFENENEIKVEMDFTEYDPENLNLFNVNDYNDDYKLLENVKNNWYENDKPEQITNSHGTIIRIFKLRETWQQKDYVELYKSIQRLIAPVDENAKKLGVDFIQDFKVSMFVNETRFISQEVVTFKDVIERAQFKMIGKVSDKGIITFDYVSSSPKREISREINLLDKENLAQNNYVSYAINRHFPSHKLPTCGGFSFTFYAFDLAKPDKMILNKGIKEFIKDNFVFVLRDGLRVYPYGEKGIDWLNLDKLRSTYRAGQFISYNDLTGFVYISQKENPLLKDSSNRQGIMDIDGALEDFKNLVTAVTEIFNTEIKIDKTRLEISKSKTYNNSIDIVKKAFNSLRDSLDKTENREVLEKANHFLKTVENQNKLVRGRMETVEDLAGLGMAVEKASHDSLSQLSRMRLNIKDFRKKVNEKNYSESELLHLLDELDENLNFVYEEMQIIQPLFKQQRKAITDVSILENVHKVIKYFRRDIHNKIDVDIIENGDLKIKTNNGLILQLLINLVDNAIYWLNNTSIGNKKLVIKIDSVNETLQIADNGPGIREDVSPLVFNEFFSLKSDGRGLGLYIVKEILLRINGEIMVVEKDEDKLLPGANFLIKFNNESN